MNKEAKTTYQVNNLIKKRWSPRAFSSDKISYETLLTLFEAASWAASCRNEQPWHFIYGVKDEDDCYERIFNSLVLWNQKWAINAPVLAVGLAKISSDYHNKPNEYAKYDLGQAVATMAIQAMADDIYIHQMAGFDKDSIIKSFKVPDEFEPIVVIAIGKLGNLEILPKDIKELELKQRSRVRIESIVSNGDMKQSWPDKTET